MRLNVPGVTFVTKGIILNHRHNDHRVSITSSTSPFTKGSCLVAKVPIVYVSHTHG